MSDIADDLYDYLAANAEVSALATVEGQHSHKTSALPRVNIWLITDLPGKHQTAGDGSAAATVQIDCRAATGAAATELANAVWGALHGYTGTMGDSKISSCFVHSMAPETESLDDASESRIHVVRVEVLIWHDVSVPTFA